MLLDEMWSFSPKREQTPKAFFSKKYWIFCIKVLIGKADRFLKTLDKLTKIKDCLEIIKDYRQKKA
jgi:hypothetical protein